MNMKEKYVSPKEFAKVLKTAKSVESFPNPTYKIVDGVYYKIIDGVMFKIKYLTNEEKQWYCLMSIDTHQTIVEISVSDGFFPIELFVGVNPKNRRFDYDSPIARKYGAIMSKNTGTACALFDANKIDLVKQVLINNHYIEQ